MPRKIPSSYLRKLNEEQKRVKEIASKNAAKRPMPVDPDSGKLKAFTMVCQTCGSQAKFNVDKFGYATCGNCRAIASYRLGHLA
jgi:ribosomal protein L37E